MSEKFIVYFPSSLPGQINKAKSESREYDTESQAWDALYKLRRDNPDTYVMPLSATYKGQEWVRDEIEGILDRWKPSPG